MVGINHGHHQDKQQEEILVMYFDLITIQKVSFYNVYKSESFLGAICCSLCQFIMSVCFAVNLLCVNNQLCAVK